VIFVTTHAYKRAKQRAGFNKKAIERMSEIAYNRGTIINDDTETKKQYGEFVYVFTGKRLLTIYRHKE